MTMTVSMGMLKFQPLVEAVIVIVISHRHKYSSRFCQEKEDYQSFKHPMGTT